MQFFFDESGDFGLSGSEGHKCAVICGLVIPETVLTNVLSDFEKFVRCLSATEMVNGEPKGKLLTDLSRAAFCEMLVRYRGQVLITPTILDLEMSSKWNAANIGTRMQDSLFEHAKKCVYDTMKMQIEEMGRQWANLSINDGLRLVCLAQALHDAIEHSVVFHSGREYGGCWDKLSFVIDPVHVAAGSREKVIFENMVLMWLTAWMKRRPLILIQEIHTPDHPFVQKYDSTGGVNLGKMLRGNLSYPDSRGSLGLQMADICANIVYQAANDLYNRNGRLGIFGSLMRNCPYGPKRGGPGIISLGSLDEQRKPAPKYKLLYEVMHAQR